MSTITMRKYARSEIDSPLRQGEIISNLIQTRLKAENHPPGELDIFDYERHPYLIVVTQDCDLEQDFKARHGDGKPHRLLPNVLLCMVHTAEDLVHHPDQSTIFKSSTVRNNFLTNKDERYHFLQAVRPEEDARGEGLPELGVEFKSYLTIPIEELYWRITVAEGSNRAQRRCRLVSPYLEHFTVRFHFYQTRVALPEDHTSD